METEESGRAFAFHMAVLGLMLDTPYGYFL